MKSIFSTPLPFYAADPAPAAEAPKDPPAPAADPNAPPAAAPKPAADPNFLANADDPAGDENKKIVAPADWPEDWRDKMAGGDEGMRKRLDRFKAPADIFKSYTELEGKFKKGAAPSDDPMPDAEKEPEKAKEWRQARGIPDDPSGYEVPDAVKSLVTDADKPKLAEFAEEMHKLGMPKSAVGPVMEWYFKNDAANREAIRTADKADQTETEDALRSDWGTDFRSNATVAKRFAEEAFPGANIWNARMPDGRTLGNIPELVKKFAELGTLEYGDVAFAGGEQVHKTTARKEEIEAMMANDPDGYRANPKLAQEYQGIMEAEQKRASRQR